MTDQSLIQTPPPGALGAPRQAPIGLEDYDPTDFRLPRLSIVQTGDQMTTWNARGGEFHDLVGGSNYPNLEGAIVLAVKKNKWFGLPYTEAQKLRDQGTEVKAWCKSANARVPDADGTAVQSTACKVCPRAKFTDLPDGGRKAPDCTDIRKILLRLKNGQIFLLVVRKTACKDVDGLVGAFFAQNMPTFTHHVDISTKAERAHGNTFYVPVFTPRWDQPVDAAMQAQLAAEAAGYAAILAHVTEDDDNGGEAGQAATGGYVQGPSSPEAYAGAINVQAQQVTPPAGTLAAAVAQVPGPVLAAALADPASQAQAPQQQAPQQQAPVTPPPAQQVAPPPAADAPPLHPQQPLTTAPPYPDPVAAPHGDPGQLGGVPHAGPTSNPNVGAPPGAPPPPPVGAPPPAQAVQQPPAPPVPDADKAKDVLDDDDAPF